MTTRSLTSHERSGSPSLTARAERDEARARLPDRDEVYDAALESFPASDAPSWGALRVGGPFSRPPVP